MADVFGYDKSTASGGIVSPSNVGIFIGSEGQMALAQSVRLKYGRNVQPVFTLGSDSVWMQPGQASGSLEVTRIVGPDGVLAHIGSEAPCETTTITLTGVGSSDCGAKFGTLTCTGCMKTSVNVEISAGQGYAVMDGVAWTVGGVMI